MTVSLKTDLRFPIPGQAGHGSRIIQKPNIIHSPVPPSLLGSYASSSTVAWVIYQKYTNGLPLYRQDKDWLQYGFALSGTTMANWVIAACTGIYLKAGKAGSGQRQ